MQISDDLFLGAANVLIPPAADQPSPTTNGVGPMGRVYIWDVVPLTLQAAGLAASQTPAGAGPLVLTAGTGVTVSQNAKGETLYTLDVPRCVTVTSGGAAAVANFTINGYDQYGQPMTQTIAGPSTSTVATTKAFKSIVSIVGTGAASAAVTAGFNDKLGMPFRVPNIGYIVSVKWNSTLADDAGTAVAADTTSPATATTTDVRGCYTPSSAADGTKRLVMCIALNALACGPQATRIGAAGVTQA